MLALPILIIIAWLQMHGWGDRVVDLLREDPTMGDFAFKGLDKYSIKLPYYVV
jgi:hypothetical protein